jgi:hypothetical protein
MKNQTGIWVDTSKAVIVTLNGAAEKITELKSDVENKIYHDKEGNKGTFSGIHHSTSENKFKERKNHDIDTFLKEIITKVKNTDEICIFGPAETKRKLEQKMIADKSFDSSKLKLVDTTSSNLTQKQIVAKVKAFYKD